MKNTVNSLKMKKEQLMMISLMILKNRVFVFKGKTLNWAKSAHEEQKSSRHSIRNSKSRSSIYSKRSLDSKCSRSSKSSYEKEVEYRVKMAELLAEA